MQTTMLCFDSPWGCTDHIIPKRRGGTNNRGNLQSLCWSCHSIKTAAIDDAIAYKIGTYTTEIEFENLGKRFGQNSDSGGEWQDDKDEARKSKPRPKKKATVKKKEVVKRTITNK